MISVQQRDTYHYTTEMYDGTPMFRYNNGSKNSSASAVVFAVPVQIGVGGILKRFKNSELRIGAYDNYYLVIKGYNSAGITLDYLLFTSKDK